MLLAKVEEIEEKDKRDFKQIFKLLIFGFDETAKLTDQLYNQLLDFIF